MEKFDHSYILVEIKSGGTSLQTRSLMIFQKHYESISASVLYPSKWKPSIGAITKKKINKRNNPNITN